LLGEDERTELERHLEACERCRGLLAEIEGVRRALREVGAGGARTAPRDCPGDGLLAAYADGSLEGRRAARIERHLAACPSCLTEVADLISMADAPERRVPDRAVEAVLARLDRDRRTAVVRLAERSVVLIRDFVRAALPGEEGATRAAFEPAFATARSGRAPIRLSWSGAGGLEVECELSRAAEGAALTGRITAGGDPARAVSVTLRSGDGTWGPESLDPRGRFGPWPLSEGTSRLVVAGGDAGEAVELSIEVEAGQEEEPRA
jgi:anti-sigma factor RsiW